MLRSRRALVLALVFVTALVAPVVPGDTLLVHAGTAIAHGEEVHA